MTQKLLRLQDAAVRIQKRYKGLLCRRAFLKLLDEMKKMKEKLRQEELERERTRCQEEEAAAARRAASRPVPLPRRRPPPIKTDPSEPPVPRPRSRLIQLSPFDNPILRPHVSSINDGGKKKLMQRRKTLLWFKETQAKKVLDGGSFPPWLHGMISRRETENILMDKEPGDFLIRISQTRAGYILSYKAHSCCRHYMVDVHSNGCYIILGEERAHTSLLSLVHFHQTTGIQPHGETLREPCGKSDTWEPDYEELKFLKKTLSLEEENVPSPAPESPDVSRTRPLSRQCYKTIRRAMHEIQQASPVYTSDGCNEEERRGSQR